MAGERNALATVVAINNRTGEVSDVELVAEVKRKPIARFTMLFERSARLAADERMTPSAWRVLWAIVTRLNYAGHDGRCYYRGTHRDLAEQTSQTRVSVTRGVARLAEIGVVKPGHGEIEVDPQYAHRGGRASPAQVVALPTSNQADE